MCLCKTKQLNVKQTNKQTNTMVDSSLLTTTLITTLTDSSTLHHTAYTHTQTRHGQCHIPQQGPSISASSPGLKTALSKDKGGLCTHSVLLLLLLLSRSLHTLASTATSPATPATPAAAPICGQEVPSALLHLTKASPVIQVHSPKMEGMT